MSKSYTLLLAAVLLLAIFAVLPAPGNAEANVPVIVGFSDQPDEKLVRQYGGTITRTYDLIDAVAVNIPEGSIGALAREKKISYVERDRKVETMAETLPWGVDRIDAELVHASPTLITGAGIDIAVIDTGIDYNHPDLDGNYQGGIDFVNDDSDPMDDRGHGTHVAGTIGAEDNDFGVVGVAPDANLYGVKVLSSTGSGYTSDVIAGVQWARTNNMHIITMSLGSDTYSQAFKDAVDAAYADGILIVAAAGNDGNRPGKGDNVDYPGAYDSVIAVAATDSKDKRAPWSSTGPKVELSAPGVSILSTYPDNSYATGSGTSMAAPHVTGVAALIMESDPSLSNVQVRSLLQSTAIDLGDTGRDTKYGYGLVDADAAVGGTPPDPDPTGGTMFVQDMDMWSQTRGKNINVYTSVTIFDTDGNAVSGASVSLIMNLPSGGTASGTGTTGTDGTVTFKYTSKISGTYQSTVSGVSKTDWTYDATKNVVSSVSLSV